MKLCISLIRSTVIQFSQTGNYVVMDNCGFHHGHFAEPELRRILAEQGVTLISQPPYSPEFNTCEFSFRVMKQFMRKHKHFSVNFTEIAI